MLPHYVLDVSQDSIAEHRFAGYTLTDQQSLNRVVRLFDKHPVFIAMELACCNFGEVES